MSKSWLSETFKQLLLNDVLESAHCDANKPEQLLVMLGGEIVDVCNVALKIKKFCTINKNFMYVMIFNSKSIKECKSLTD